MRPLVLAALVGLIVLPTTATAQLPQASAATLDRGHDPTAHGGGFAAIASNPAGLALPDAPSFSMVLPSVGARAGLGPVTWQDLVDWQGELIDDGTRADWYGRVEAEGGQTVRSGVGVTGLALTIGSVGLQVSARAAAQADLSQDAVELLLYGNAGLDGVPHDFDLAGSGMDGYALTTTALSFGMTLTDGFYVGASAKYSVGNALAFGRNVGSFVTADPLEVGLDFPIMYSPTDPYHFDQGHGFGMDLGAIMEGDPITIGLMIENVFNTFGWDLQGYSYIPGQAVFDADVRESDFDETPLADAPQSVREYFRGLADDLEPETRVSAGVSWPAAPTLRLYANAQKSLTDGMAFDPDFYGGVGAEWTGISFFHLRGHGAVITDGYELSGGASLILGPVHLSGGVGTRSESSQSSLLATFALSFGSH
jgi:hypothetical protein